MASILRSGKFVRYFASLTRSFVFNSLRETESNFLQNTSCICGSFTQNFATAAAKPDQSLERSLKRLDQDVRRTGRISRRDIEEILEEIRQQRSATSSQSLLVIRCCGSLVPEELPEVRTALVQEIWKTLNALNVPMDISHYNALLRVYLENEHPFSPTDFLADLEAKGIEPNRVTYQRLIARYCQQGDIEGATQILEFMREKELPVNENVFNALILGHSQANDMESAAGIIPVMKQAGLEPSADTYATLLCCYARHGDMEALAKTLEECDKNDIYLLDKDLLDVIYSLTVNGHGDKVDAVTSRIRKSAGYNQDAVNLILRLTNKGYEDIAFKILKTMPRATRTDGSLIDTGNFFIRQLVKANRPFDEILKICKEMQDENLNSRALLVATEASLTSGLYNSAFLLLKELKKSGVPIRQHFFWPLICSAESNQVFDILKKMQDEFDINPSSETIRDYVIPNLKETNLNKVVSSLRSFGVTLSTAAASVAYSALQQNKLNEAAEIAMNYKAYYSPGLFRKPLVQALGKTNDFESYVKFVRQMYDCLPRISNIQPNQAEEEEADSSTDAHVSQAEVLGQVVYDAAIYFKRDRTEVLEKILTGLVEQGLSISNAQAERIQDKLGSEMSSTISELLGKLSGGDLQPVPVLREGRRSTLDDMSVEELEKFIETCESKNENTNRLKRQLISACFKSRNLEKTEEVISKLKQENFVISSGVYAQLIDLYCFHEKLDAAIDLYKKLKAKEPDFILDNLKAIKIANLMVKLDKVEDAINFLEENKKEEPTTDASFNYKTTCWRLLNSLAESGDATNLQRVFDTLAKNNYIEASNVLLGPLIKVHLVNNDLQKAVDTFEEICNKYQATPWKNELACRLIQAEDATNLQKLTDLSTNIHGEVNSLYDLVFSFVECGRIRQARKILETPGLRNRPQRINSACERYRQEGLIQPLEGLVEATKDLNHIDRGDIYYNLLLSYCKEDKPEKALGLWTKMQEDDITPSDAFLQKLGEYLIEKNLEVPFVMPAAKVEPTEVETKVSTEKTSKLRTTSKSLETGPKYQFKKALKSSDIDAVITAKQQLPSDVKLNISEQSLFLEALVRAERMSEATKCVYEILEQKLHPLPRIFKFYLNKLALSGDIVTLERIGSQISNDMKKTVSFDNKLCNAYVIAGKAESYLNKLNEYVDKSSSEDEVRAYAEQFPRGGAFGILEKHPELISKFEELSERYASRGILAPMNVLWIYQFVKGNSEAAKKVFNKYLMATPRLMFQKILQEARKKQDEDLICELVSNLKQAKVSEGALGNAYSCWLDVLSSKERFEEGLEVLKKAIAEVCLENINRTALKRLKDGLESKGQSFPYTIPEKTSRDDTTSSSTSSSSDEDIPPTKPESLSKMA